MNRLFFSRKATVINWMYTFFPFQTASQQKSFVFLSIFLCSNHTDLSLGYHKKAHMCWYCGIYFFFVIDHLPKRGIKKTKMNWSKVNKITSKIYDIWLKCLRFSNIHRNNMLLLSFGLYVSIVSTRYICQIKFAMTWNR